MASDGVDALSRTRLVSAPVISSRATFAALICASALALAACGGGDDTTAAPAPSTTTAAAPAPSATSAAPSAATGGTGIGAGDKKICESANKAGEKMKDDFVAAMTSGEPSPAKLKQILGELDSKLSAVAGDADTKVAAAAKQMAAEAEKAASAADPMDAAANSGFEKAGSDLTAACKAAGVKVNF